jgi:hypothetical protein
LLPSADSLDPQARAELLWTVTVTAREVGDDTMALSARQGLAPLLEGIADPYLHAASQLAMAWTSPIVDDLDSALREASASLEEFQTSKGLCGLDQHQVRRWRSWYRWVTLAMVAHAFLVAAALTQHTRHPPPPELLPLSCNEVSHLSAALLARPLSDRAYRLRWSAWRRRHQARARTCHYRRQAAWDP